MSALATERARNDASDRHPPEAPRPVRFASATRPRGFAGVVGSSAALGRVLAKARMVAETDSTVLVTGETGTGKELVARGVHDLSPRRSNAFVTVNCAAIPATLLESELFGHERGAFTGAVSFRAGRFEVADGGTIFLDEIGDLPLDIQPKLLRVLQEGQFERLGSSRSQRANVRIVAATHRNLARMVEEGTFRADLYYRIAVFPIVMPSLRERRDDIAPLARHFIDVYAERVGRRVGQIPESVFTALSDYDWPGNVRELQNAAERAVILAANGVVSFDVPSVTSARSECAAVVSAVEISESVASGSDALIDVERAHISRVLRATNWVISGPRGAAVRLGMRRATLAARIRKLGIVRDEA